MTPSISLENVASILARAGVAVTAPPTKVPDELIYAAVGRFARELRDCAAAVQAVKAMRPGRPQDLLIDTLLDKIVKLDGELQAAIRAIGGGR